MFLCREICSLYSTFSEGEEKGRGVDERKVGIECKWKSSIGVIRIPTNTTTKIDTRYEIKGLGKGN